MSRDVVTSSAVTHSSAHLTLNYMLFCCQAHVYIWMYCIVGVKVQLWGVIVHHFPNFTTTFTHTHTHTHIHTHTLTHSHSHTHTQTDSITKNNKHKTRKLNVKQRKWECHSQNFIKEYERIYQDREKTIKHTQTHSDEGRSNHTPTHTHTRTFSHTHK